VPLVSREFLTSKFIINYELPRVLADAKREGKKIFRIPVTPSTIFEANEELTVLESLLKIRGPRCSSCRRRSYGRSSARLRAAATQRQSRQRRRRTTTS
jgi:hypothetical protein